jgi:hypothetical protein
MQKAREYEANQNFISFVKDVFDHTCNFHQIPRHKEFSPFWYIFKLNASLQHWKKSMSQFLKRNNNMFVLNRNECKIIFLIIKKNVEWDFNDINSRKEIDRLKIRRENDNILETYIN